MLNPISTVTLIKLPHHFVNNSDLMVMEGVSHVPFPFVRVLVARTPVGGCGDTLNGAMR